MSLRVEFAAWWDADMNLRTARYAEKAGSEIAERFVQAVETTVQQTIHILAGGRSLMIRKSVSFTLGSFSVLSKNISCSIASLMMHRCWDG